MPINLSNVNISIQQFQDISSGKYNAGEVALASETTLTKVNNHVRQRGSNNVSLSHTEVLAVKQAFVKALAQVGVDDEEVSRVRAQLGLAPEKAVDTQLKERSLKPLSRQQIREILDRNAAAINAHEHGETIRTSDQIYADVDAETRQQRAATRNATNVGLAEHRTVTELRQISLFQAIVAGDVDFHSRADRADLLKLANQVLYTVLKDAGGHPRAGVPAKAALGVNGERRIVMEAGMDEVAFVRKLEDAIVRLQGFGPPADTIELRNAFRAVPREGRSQWIANMIQSGDKVTYKARILAVMLLQDAGVDDCDSLSLPNSLPGPIATTLLRNLAALPEGASAEAARHCLDAVRDGAVDGIKNDLAYVPATSTKEFNNAVVSAIANSNERLFGEFQTLAYDVLAEVRAIFGPVVVPENTNIRLFVSPIDVQYLAQAQGENVRLAPGPMRDGLKAAVIAAAAAKALCVRVETRIDEQKLDLNPNVVVNLIRNRQPDLIDRLIVCHTLAQVTAMLDSIRLRIDAELRRAAAIKAMEEKFAAMVHKELSARTGIPVSSLGDEALSRVRLNELASGTSHKIIDGEIPSDTPEQIEKAFHDTAERFAAERAAILEKADSLALSDASKAELKTWLLSQDKVRFLDLDAILAEARKIDLAPLADALRKGKPKADVYAAMKPFTDTVGQRVRALLAGKVDAIGSPESTNVSTILLIAALDPHPGICNDLAAFFARPEVQADDMHRFYANHESYPSNSFTTFGRPPADEAWSELAQQIADGAAPPVYAQALVRAVRAEGIRFPSKGPNTEGRELSPDEVAAVFSAGTPLGKALAEVLGGFSGEFSPNALEFIARGALRQIGGGKVPQMVELMRHRAGNAARHARPRRPGRDGRQTRLPVRH